MTLVFLARFVKGLWEAFESSQTSITLCPRPFGIGVLAVSSEEAHPSVECSVAVTGPSPSLDICWVAGFVFHAMRFKEALFVTTEHSTRERER